MRSESGESQSRGKDVTTKMHLRHHPTDMSLSNLLTSRRSMPIVLLASQSIHIQVFAAELTALQNSLFPSSETTSFVRNRHAQQPCRVSPVGKETAGVLREVGVDHNLRIHELCPETRHEENSPREVGVPSFNGLSSVKNSHFSCDLGIPRE